MRLASFLKDNDSEIVSDPLMSDTIFISLLYSKNYTNVKKQYKSAIIGGTGCPDCLDVEKLRPPMSFFDIYDYSIYKGTEVYDKKIGVGYCEHGIEQIMHPEGDKLILLDNPFSKMNWEYLLSRIETFKQKICIMDEIKIDDMSNEMLSSMNNVRIFDDKFESEKIVIKYIDDEQLKRIRKFYDGSIDVVLNQFSLGAGIYNTLSLCESLNIVPIITFKIDREIEERAKAVSFRVKKKKNDTYKMIANKNRGKINKKANNGAQQLTLF